VDPTDHARVCDKLKGWDINPVSLEPLHQPAAKTIVDAAMADEDTRPKDLRMAGSCSSRRSCTSPVPACCRPDHWSEQQSHCYPEYECVRKRKSKCERLQTVGASERHREMAGLDQDHRDRLGSTPRGFLIQPYAEDTPFQNEVALPLLIYRRARAQVVGMSGCWC
jgi:hypothetical protein